MVFFVTVIAVSIDAYLAGLAYSLKRPLMSGDVLYISSFTYFVTLISFILNVSFVKNLPFVEEIGAIIFVLIGAKNYSENAISGKRLLPKKRGGGSPALLGLAVSADAGLASLSLEVASRALIPVYSFAMFAAHFFFLYLGTVTVRLVSVMKKISGYSGVALIALGLFKLLF